MPLRMKNLQELKPDEETWFGGKACGLARLIAAGAIVPPGFAVEATTSPPDQWSNAERESFCQKTAELLEHGPLAVRSSGIEEDSAEKSFAGLFETVLGIHTVDEALTAVAYCVASGKRDRVLKYAKAGSPLPVGIVVQTLIDAWCAGVCFTRDPTGKDGAVVVEAVKGTGDKLVSGAAAPERWRIYKSDLGGFECRSEKSDTVLGVPEVGKIAVRALTLAERFGFPLDLEWAIDSTGKLWWLQARPITAAKAPPEYVIQRFFDGVDDGPVTVWSNWNVRETLPDPMFPLTWTVWRDIILPMATSQIFGIPQSSPIMRHMCVPDLVHGRIYFNMNGFMAVPLFGSMASRILASVDSRAGETMRELILSGVIQPRKVPGSRVSISLRILGASLLSLLRLAGALMPRRALRMLEENAVEVSQRPAVTELSNQKLIDEMYLFMQPECRRLRYGLQYEMVAVGIYNAALAAFKDHPEARSLLATGIPANPTTQISLAIEDLTDAARPMSEIFLESLSTEELLKELETQSGGVEWLNKFRDFLDRFGHRGPMEFDMGASRWTEDPTMIVGLVREGLRSPVEEHLRTRMARMGNERKEAIEKAVACAAFWRRPIMRSLARLVELYMPLREAPKHCGVVVFQRMRHAALELGKRLKKDRAVDTIDDVFFLEWPELVTLAHGRQPAARLGELIRERREQFARFKAERAPGFLRSDGVPVGEDISPDQSADGVLRGTAVSAGHAKGAVRILKEPDPAAMSDGDVIVMEFADPGWTPLFPRASAVIMEIGGLMCHAAVVAREMGIPAVFGVHDATSLLADGQHVEVDGTLGTIKYCGDRDM